MRRSTRKRPPSLRQALHKRFYEPATRSYASGAQPYLAFPLFVGIVPSELRPAVMKNLEETILVKDSGHIDAGMHGTYFLLKYLMEQDRNDLIDQMVSKRDYPSWGYMLDRGATTIWEDWSGSMSHIHDTLISVGAWFLQGIGGIRIDEKSPGFRHFFIKPGVVGDLTFARAPAIDRRTGPSSATGGWSGKIHLKVSVPPGATARVYVPTSTPTDVTEGQGPAGQAPGVRAVAPENNKAVFEVLSGDYAFEAPWYWYLGEARARRSASPPPPRGRDPRSRAFLLQ